MVLARRISRRAGPVRGNAARLPCVDTCSYPKLKGLRVMGIIFIIGIGFVAGILAKVFMPSFKRPSGYGLATTLGALGAVIASFMGLMLGWFWPGQGAGLLAAAVGAIAALAGWDHAQKRA